jgi:sRNA-binding protein
MSNPSLKEQLQAVAPKFSDVAIKDKKTSSQDKMQKESKPIWLAYLQYGVELLKAHFPQCFKENSEVQPLKIGIKKELVIRLGAKDDIAINDKACMIKSLTYYVNTTAYHKRMTAGVARIDLDGATSGIVTPEEANYSAQRWQTKNQRKPSAKKTEHEITSV